MLLKTKDNHGSSHVILIYFVIVVASFCETTSCFQIFRSFTRRNPRPRVPSPHLNVQRDVVALPFLASLSKELRFSPWFRMGDGWWKLMDGWWKWMGNGMEINLTSICNVLESKCLRKMYYKQRVCVVQIVCLGWRLCFCVLTRGHLLENHAIVTEVLTRSWCWKSCGRTVDNCVLLSPTYWQIARPWIQPNRGACWYISVRYEAGRDHWYYNISTSDYIVYIPVSCVS